ncbi:MAG: sulfatase [Chloroflexi bacterium]|nr:sulfatase [Chloroflexota bacterium]
MPQPDEHPRPNIVFIFADQLRASAVGYMGNHEVHTPALDRLAAQGVVFSSAVCGCPVCTPYRACMLTGRYPLTHGVFVNDVRLPEEELTFGELYSAAGYDTAYIGKWHLDGPQRSAFTPPGPRRHGFSYWAVGNCTHDYFHSLYYRDDPEPRYWQGYDAHAQARLACEYITQHGQRNPYCLFLSWGPPHNPYEWTPQEYLRRYPPDDIRVPPNVPQADKEALAGYYAHITALDDALGWILEAVRTSGQEDDTIVVFTSDHGDMLGSHGLWRKQWPWDDCMLVPLVVRYPAGQRPACWVDVPFNAVDLLPTLLNLCGLSIPGTVEGSNLAHLVRGQPGEAPRSALMQIISPFCESIEPEWRAVRTSRYTYARNLAGSWLLYDNLTDPYQIRNLVAGRKYAGLCSELEHELRIWLARTHDEFLPAAVYRERYGITDVDERFAVPITM